MFYLEYIYSVLNIAGIKFKDVAVPCLLFISNFVYVYASFFPR